MDRGKLIDINKDKRCGYIILNDGNKAVFNVNCLYRTANFDDFVEGQEVEFYLQQSYNGFLAIEIRTAEISKIK